MVDRPESPSDDKLGGRKQDEVQTSSPLSELSITPSGGSDVSEVEKGMSSCIHYLSQYFVYVSYHTTTKEKKHK